MIVPRHRFFVCFVCLVLFGVLGAADPAAPQTPEIEAASCRPQPPVTLTAEERLAGWLLRLEIPSDQAYTDVLVGFDDAPPASIGHEHVLDVYTGLPRVRDRWILRAGVPPGPHRVEVRLVRKDGKVDGPYLHVFDVAEERLAEAKKALGAGSLETLSFAEHGDEVTWLGFSMFFERRDSIREVHYSVDSCSLDEHLVFAADFDAEPVAEGRRIPNDLVIGRPVLTLPKATTRSACAQAVFRDGTRSRVLEAHRPPQERDPFDPEYAAGYEPEPEPVPTPCACLPDPVLPVALATREWRGTWTLTFRTPACPPVVEMRVGVDGAEPRSLGHRSYVDPRTGRPDAVQELTIHAVPGQAERDRNLLIELVRPDGKVDGPYPLLFSPRQERIAAAKETLAQSPYTYVSFAEHGSDSTWLGFNTLFDLGTSLREVRYSIDDCTLGKRLVFGDDGIPVAVPPPVEPRDLVPDRPFLTLPRDTTRSACVQVVFADGTASEVLEIVRDPKYRVRR